MLFPRIRLGKRVYVLLLLKEISVVIAGGLGFNIKGGRDKPLRPGDPGIYVTRLRPGAAADKDGQLQPGDRILEVCWVGRGGKAGGGGGGGGVYRKL